MLKSIIRNNTLRLRKKKYNIKKNVNFKLIKRYIFKYKKKIIVGGYFPVSYEIDCLKILKKLDQNNIQISLPKIKNNNQMEFFKYSFKDPMFLNKYGIPEPINKKKVIPDLIFVPLVAFDKNLYRIGYGGGYYDRYIKKIHKKKKIIKIGFAFSFQKVNKIPADNFDQKLDAVITENKLYK